MPESDICRKCQKPKTSTSAGFVTQFIDVCQCDVLPIEQSQTISICSKCNMRIAKNIGSMTQWIFGQGKCECDRPQPTDTPIEEFINPSLVGITESENETYLDLDSEKFPIERYLPIAELGKGASGIVYLCRDNILNKKVAVKTLLDLNADQLISFQEEAKATAKLDHPNIIKILDFGASESGTPYMVMDYMPGISLEKFIEKFGTLKEETARIVFSKLAEALDYAHNQNVFHRDLKPSNILLHETDEETNVTLIDFGIARVKESTGLITKYQDKSLAGTPAYMSPDATRGEKYDSQSEIYSLGCVLLTALTGTPPFLGETSLETLSMHATKYSPVLEQVKIESEREIWNIIEKCLSKQKADRFDSIKELGETLIKKAEQSVENYKTPFEPVAPQTSTNNRFVILAITAVALLAVAWSFYQFSRFLNPADNSQYKVHSVTPKSFELEKDQNIIRLGKGRFGFVAFNKRSFETLENLQREQDIVELEFANCNLSHDLMKPLKEYPIKSIKLHVVNLDAKTINEFRKIKTLKYFTLDQIELNSDLIIALKELPLTQLNIVDCILSPQILKQLSQTSMDILIGTPFYKVDDSNLIEMTKMTNLKYFILWHMRSNREQPPKIWKIKSLKKLSISSSWTDVSTTVKVLSTIPNLDTLFWRDHKIKKPADLVKIKKLKVLGVDTVSKKFLKIAPKLNLKNLKIYSRGNNFEQLLSLSKIASLKELELQSTPDRKKKFTAQFESLKSDCKVKYSDKAYTFFGCDYTNLVDEMNESIWNEKSPFAEPTEAKTSAQELILKQIKLEEGIADE